ncbi:hypothetical protein JIN84_13145 [Luteolibacter yonseiensis]|uniref:Uncharacterized protein n=1 Tax=Luteolibacter yonseiensis TaxID=1144680 RepID=A0A934R7C4_9BACT|nr:hypothetical protein [Luteolibacter yonseiensis]MBK1816565.1 hypothetical protein [Luteolibacter yonseiensis]
MSLPQRKKSAEEIAKLRESLGIGGFPVAEAPGVESPPKPATAVAVPAPAAAPVEPPVRKMPDPPEVVEAPQTPAATAPPPVEAREPKAVHSLKRSERVPVLSADPTKASPSQGSFLPVPNPILAVDPPPGPKAPKRVRSLRKSEQIPLPAAHAPPKDSTLPIHRHSDEELGEIRRREMLANSVGAAPPPVLAAHPVLYAPGYLLVLGSAAGIYFYDVDKMVPAGCVVTAFLIATFIFVKKPLSRHHAAFIAVMALFLIIFGALYYFPQLQHGT